MTGGLSQLVRCIASVAEDTPIADRFHAALDASDAFIAACDNALEAHRSDCRTRYGYDFGEKVK